MSNVTYEINTEMVFSTAHITERDDTMANRKTGFSALLSDSVDGGFRVLVNKESFEKLPSTTYSSEFQELYRIALEQQCKWLVLDRDGQIYSNLPTFEW